MTFQASDRVILALAVLVALLSALPYAGSWNDGSRLASVESLVDHGTFAIDSSIFVEVPSRDSGRFPYGGSAADLLEKGTLDKMQINGRFYSDKPMLQTVLMAGEYWLLQKTFGLSASQQPRLFCWLMTVGSSGLAYVLAVWAMLRIAHIVGLDARLRGLFVGSFALATAALPYTRHVNQHIALLAVACLLIGELLQLREDCLASRQSWLRFLRIGLLAGLGYGLDLGTGPPLACCVFLLVAFRSRSLPGLAVMLLAMLPGVATYHAINYEIGGTFKPANANPEYFQWDGCPFHTENLTGGLKHNVVGAAVYGGDLLLGKRGFLEHNLPLLLIFATLGTGVLWRARERAELVFALSWSLLTWGAYTLASDNLSGACYSIRWFVPLLAPAYLSLAVLLRDATNRVRDFTLLSGWGVVMAGLGWWAGPWLLRMVPMYWFLVGFALLSWGFVSFRRAKSVVERPDIVVSKAA